MSDERRYYRLGLFVICGVSLAVAVLLVFGSDVFSRPGPMLETYIDESVQGLDVGAPLRYRGVKIGRVEQIGFAEGLYTMRGDSEEVRRLGRLVVMRMRVDRAWAERNGSGDYEREIKRLVEQGLRVRVAAQGLTGTSYLEADYLDPQRNPPMKIAWKPAYIYVPSAQSAISRLGRGAEEVFDRISALDIESVVSHLDGALVSGHQGRGRREARGREPAGNGAAGRGAIDQSQPGHARAEHRREAHGAKTEDAARSVRCDAPAGRPAPRRGTGRYRCDSRQPACGIREPAGGHEQRPGLSLALCSSAMPRRSGFLKSDDPFHEEAGGCACARSCTGRCGLRRAKARIPRAPAVRARGHSSTGLGPARGRPRARGDTLPLLSAPRGNELCLPDRRANLRERLLQRLLDCARGDGRQRNRKVAAGVRHLQRCRRFHECNSAELCSSKGRSPSCTATTAQPESRRQ